VSEVEESEADHPEGALGLADFLADLREELAEGQQRAEGSSLKLGVEEVTVSLEVAVTTARKGGVSGKVRAKFWVLSAELGGSAERSSQRVGTQKLTLSLKPRIEQVTYDAQDRVQQVTSRALDVAGDVAAGEDSPRLRRPAEQPAADD
jgi:hypothetical protein